MGWGVVEPLLAGGLCQGTSRAHGAGSCPRAGLAVAPGGCLGFTQQRLSLGLEEKGERTLMALILEVYISLHAGLLAVLCKARSPRARCPTEGGTDGGHHREFGDLKAWDRAESNKSHPSAWSSTSPSLQCCL